MKFLSAQCVFLALLLLPVGAFAGTTTHKGSLDIADPVQVAGQHLAAGQYTVKWTSPGPATELNILRDGKVVASVSAQVVQLPQKPGYDTVDTRTTRSGVNELTMIEFGGKNYALKINNAAGNAGSGSGL